MNKLLWTAVFVISTIPALTQVNDLYDINFTKADSVARVYQGHDFDNIPLLSFKLTASLPTEVEKFRAIYTWVCQNIENDYGLYAANKKKRKRYASNPNELQQWNDDLSQKVFIKLEKEGKTVCTGYAYLLQELSACANISCKLVNGYGRTSSDLLSENSLPNHSWNAVQINNKWYLCDATWSSGSFDLNSYTFIQNYNDGYFLCKPSLFAKNHYPLDTIWLLMDAKPSFKDFISAPITYNNAFKHRVFANQPNHLNIYATSGQQIKISVEVLNPIVNKKLKLAQAFRKYDVELETEVTQLSESEYQLTTSFKRKGQYDLHVKYAGDVIATYVVYVE